MLDKNRFISITDAIIAVAATIMVLKLNIPEYASAEAIKSQLPVLTAYVISFMQIFLDWHEHHDTFIYAEKINHRIFLLNCVWLMTITLIPFATGMVGQNTDHKESLLVYIGILLIEQLLLIAESKMVSDLNGIEIHDRMIIRKTRIITLVALSLGMLAALLVPALALAIVLVGCAVNIVLICVYDKQISAK